MLRLMITGDLLMEEPDAGRLFNDAHGLLSRPMC